MLRRLNLKPSRSILAATALAIGLTGSLVLAYEFHLFGLGTADCWVQPAGSPGSAVFTVVMANEGVNIGFNGSRNHSPPWPVLNVTRGQSVIVHVINNDSREAHGFQITHYFEQGIGGRSGLAPGKCFDVKFTADDVGTFLVQCNIFCTIHQSMLDGRLNVG